MLGEAEILIMYENMKGKQISEPSQIWVQRLKYIKTTLRTVSMLVHYLLLSGC